MAKISKTKVYPRDEAKGIVGWRRFEKYSDLHPVDVAAELFRADEEWAAAAAKIRFRDTSKLNWCEPFGRVLALDVCDPAARIQEAVARAYSEAERLADRHADFISGWEEGSLESRARDIEAELKATVFDFNTLDNLLLTGSDLVCSSPEYAPEYKEDLSDGIRSAVFWINELLRELGDMHRLEGEAEISEKEIAAQYNETFAAHFPSFEDFARAVRNGHVGCGTKLAPAEKRGGREVSRKFLVTRLAEVFAFHTRLDPTYHATARPEGLPPTQWQSYLRAAMDALALPHVRGRGEINDLEALDDLLKKEIGVEYRESIAFLTCQDLGELLLTTDLLPSSQLLREFLFGGDPPEFKRRPGLFGYPPRD